MPFSIGKKLVEIHIYPLDAKQCRLDKSREGFRGRSRSDCVAVAYTLPLRLLLLQMSSLHDRA